MRHTISFTLNIHQTINFPLDVTWRRSIQVWDGCHRLRHCSPFPLTRNRANPNPTFAPMEHNFFTLNTCHLKVQIHLFNIEYNVKLKILTIN